MINNVVIMGRLTKDAEERKTNSGKSVCSICVAVDRRFVKQGEERQTDFIDVVAFDKSAAFISKYFHRGSMIAVRGSIQTRMYEDKNGNKRKAVEIVADEVSFCGGKNEGSAPVTPTITPSDDDYRDIPELEDDGSLPF